MKITIKETKKLDYEKVVDIYYSVKFLTSRDRRQKNMQEIKKAFLNYQYVVSAWVDNELVGFATVLTDTVIFATIWNCIVRPEYQGKGIGRMLIKKCLGKYPKLHFYVFTDKKSYVFYEKNGFKLQSYGMIFKN